MKEEVRKEVTKLLEVGLIYPISDSAWASPVQVVPKKGGMTMVRNEKNDLIPILTVTEWRMCIDYQKLNDATRKDHFPLGWIFWIQSDCCRSQGPREDGHSVSLPIEGCHLDYAMLQLPLRGVEMHQSVHGCFFGV